MNRRSFLTSIGLGFLIKAAPTKPQHLFCSNLHTSNRAWFASLKREITEDSGVTDIMQGTPGVMTATEYQAEYPWKQFSTTVKVQRNGPMVELLVVGEVA